MARWEPDAGGRLAQAALDLFEERGFEQTTVLDIARRAGVTERTFFRNFSDKREALFHRSHELQEAVVSAIAETAESCVALDAAVRGIEAGTTILEARREYSRQRAAVVASHPSLQERELLKLAALRDAIADALRERGAPGLDAALAAETAVLVFKVGFERWISDAADTRAADRVREALDELKALTAGA